MLWLLCSSWAAAPLLSSPGLVFVGWLWLHHLGFPVTLASSFLTGKDNSRDTGGKREAARAFHPSLQTLRAKKVCETLIFSPRGNENVYTHGDGHV